LTLFLIILALRIASNIAPAGGSAVLQGLRAGQIQLNFLAIVKFGILAFLMHEIDEKSNN
jgi:hypothetical protein